MPESILSRQATRLRLAWEASPLRRFLHWWGRELVAALPARVREVFAERRPELLVAIDAERVRYRRIGPEAGEVATLELGNGPDLARGELARELTREQTPPRVVLCIPEQRVLRRQIGLPAAAEENLRQVLGFEMDRQTPFRADQVYFDQHVLRRDPTTREIAVDLALAPRAALDATLERAQQLGLALDAVDLGSIDTATRAGFNLLPPERRAVHRNLWLRVNLALGAAAVVLLGLVMAQSVANRERALEALSAATSAAQVEARQVSELRNALKEAIDGANFLNQRRRSVPSTMDLMLDVTQRLPNDTWLQRLSINGTQVQLQGQSAEAAALITVLQRSPYLEGPALQGAITPDARTGKEQFLIQATARLPEPAPPAATPAAQPEVQNAVASGT